MTMPPFQPLPCEAAGGAGADVEGTLVCDVNAAGDVVGVALVEAVYDETGARTGTRLVNVVDGTVYVPQGTVRPCPEGCCPEPVALCDVQADGSVVPFIRTYRGQADGGVTVVDQLLDGSAYTPTGTVGSCEPYSSCTPSPNLDLAGECGPGEPVDKQVLLDDPSKPLSNSVFNDDASADALCGDSWDRSADELQAPFPVNESFRNATYDQPGPVLQGTAPYPDLTADTDGAGAGWLRVSDITSGTNGLWQVPSPFPTVQGMNAGITFASHDGTTPGGDGMAFVFTDGSLAPQGIPVGGFGNLGLQNWQGGYVAIVLDEYGQTCTCSQAAQGAIDPSPGPCGFCTNTISIQLAGAARQGASCACCTIASASLVPKALNQTTRFSPARLLISIIEEGGQTYVSASVDWNDGAGPVQYFDRVNVTACAGPAPATLRMAAYGGSGGSYRAIKEIRDAVARPAGVSNWRAFPITSDPVPACATGLTVSADLDVTFTADDQTTGNNNPEAYLWLVNDATGAVLDRASVSSLPSQVGDVHHLSVSADVTPADLPNLRVYVGAESRDDTGTYSSLWENLDVGVVATGCPAQPVRTLAISAPCPIPVTIVGGSGDGEGGGTTVFNAPSTFEDAAICAIVAGEQVPGFRRETRSPDGTVEVVFLGVDGLTITPDTWTAGPCCCDGRVTLGEVCYVDPASPSGSRPGFLVEDGDGDRHVFNLSGVEVTPFPTIVICPSATYYEEILCDAGNGGHPFIRRYIGSNTAGINDLLNEFELDGSTLYVPVGPVGLCGEAGRDSEVVELCDSNGVFLRRLLFDDAGAVVGSTDFTLAGIPYVPVGVVTYGCTDPTATAQVYASCDDIPTDQFTTGPNLLTNGDFERSTGQGASSVAGPGWTTQYTACGPDLFLGPCGANNWSFFTTNAGQVMGSGPAPNIEALGARSMAVNVGPNVNLAIIEWPNVYLENGKTYELSADAAVNGLPFDIALKIGGPAAPGGLFPLSTPPTGNWGKTTATFTWGGVTGFTSVGLYSNNATPGGNDHTFDNFSLHTITQANAGATTPRVYSGTQRAVIEQVVETAGCNDDRRDALLGEIANAVMPEEGAALDSTVQRQVNAGTVTIPARARSVTVTVLAGTATVNLGQGVQTIPAGVSLSWGVDGPGETLVEAFAFTGIAGSDFIVTSTRQ